MEGKQMTTPTTITIPVDPSFDDLDKAFGGMTPAQLGALASSMLSFARIPHQLWLPGDIEERFDVEIHDGATRYRVGDRLFTRAERDLIIEEAQQQRAWDNLGDADDLDWMMIDQAISDALETLDRQAAEVGEDALGEVDPE